MIQKYLRPKVTEGQTIGVKTGCGTLFIIINHDKDSLIPIEIFSHLGHAGACPASSAEAICRLISLSLRKGAAVDDIINQLRGIRCEKPVLGNGGSLSCADSVAEALIEYMEVNKLTTEFKKYKHQ